MSKIAKESIDVVKERLLILRKIIPDCFTDGKLDLVKLRKTLGETLEGNDEKYTFSWAGRNETYKNIQATSKGTLIPIVEDSINFDVTKNMIIEGDNLEILKLFQKSYFEKIKMIYIDPPYNTGNDFIYKDDFSNSIQAYLEQTNQITGGIKLTTNPETSGRFHSSWISFMYARLFLARNLLRNDGIIFVSIDDNEVHNLRLIMNEIFGEENFLATAVWQKKYVSANDAKGISATHEYVLIYAKNAENWNPGLFERNEEQLSAFQNLDNDPRGPWRASDLSARTYSAKCDYEITGPTGKKFSPPPSRSWVVNKQRYNELLEDNRITFGRDGNGRPMLKKFLNEVKEGITPDTWWKREKAGDNKEARYEIKDIFPENLFDTPKPTKLLKLCLSIANCKDDDVVMDFFAGSGVLGDAVLQFNDETGKNLKFILVQLPEKVAKESEAYKKGYRTISDICTERMRRVIKRIENKNKQQKLVNKNKLDLGFKLFKLDKSNFQIWENYHGKDIKTLKDQMKLFQSPLLTGVKDLDVIYECIIKEGFDLNSTMEKTDVKTNTIYKVSDIASTFYITLDKTIKNETIDKLNLAKDDLFICIDAALDDNKKTNLSKQCNLKTL